MVPVVTGTNGVVSHAFSSTVTPRARSSLARHHAQSAVPRTELFRCHGWLVDKATSAPALASRRWDLDRAVYHQPSVSQGRFFKLKAHSDLRGNVEEFTVVFIMWILVRFDVMVMRKLYFMHTTLYLAFVWEVVRVCWFFFGWKIMKWFLVVLV